MIRLFATTFALVALFPVLLVVSPAVRGQDSSTPAASPAATDIGMSGTGAAYMVIRNAGAEADRLVAGETHAAEVVEIHEIVDTEGVMEMRPLADGLEIPAGGEVTLEPGGYHVMLIGLTEDLRNGDTFDLTLRFERAGEILVPVPVRPRAELSGDATPAAPLVAGEIAIADAWSRPAPALGAAATPAATPSA